MDISKADNHVQSCKKYSSPLCVWIYSYIIHASRRTTRHQHINKADKQRREEYKESARRLRLSHAGVLRGDR
jgi:hypothetical protein